MNRAILLSFAAFGLVLLVIGCREKHEESRVKIGVLLPLTGPSANQGQDALNAIRMKLDEIGGPEGTGIEVVVEDEKSSPAQAIGAFQKLTDVDKVPLIIGPVSSSIVLGLAPEANRREVVILASARPETGILSQMKGRRHTR